MIEQHTFYLVTYSHSTDLDTIKSKSELRLYDSIKEAAEIESTLLSLRYQYVALAVKEIELGFNATYRDLVFGTQYSFGARDTLSKLTILKVELEDSCEVVKQTIETPEPLYLSEDSEDFITDFELSNGNTISTKYSDYMDIYGCTINCSLISGDKVKNIEVVGESVWVIDEDINGLIKLHNEALEIEMNNYLL